MRRKTMWYGGGILLIVAGLLITLTVLIKHEPGFYSEKAIAASTLRIKHSKTFVGNAFFIYNSIENRHKQWGGTFTEAQINSYLAEDFVKSRMDKVTLPDSISEPRIAIDQDRIRIGFRYGQSPWSTIISVDLRVWMAPKKRNVIVMQLEGVYAGALPISSRMVMDSITATIRAQSSDIEITWYRHEGQLTALLRLGGSRPRPTHQLRQFKVDNHMLIISGKTVPEVPPEATESEPRAAIPSREIK